MSVSKTTVKVAIRGLRHAGGEGRDLVLLGQFVPLELGGGVDWRGQKKHEVTHKKNFL